MAKIYNLNLQNYVRSEIMHRKINHNYQSYHHLQNGQIPVFTEHRSNHFIYAGLATITLIGGMGTTPIILAETLAIEQSESVKKDNTVDDNTTDDSPIISAPDALPKVELSPTTSKPSVLENNVPKQITQKSLQPKEPKATSYNLVVTDFNISGTHITGFTSEFLGSSRYSTWDGNLTFPPELSTITDIDSYSFYGSTDRRYRSVKTVDFSGLVNLVTIGERAFGTNPSLTSIKVDGLMNLTTIDINAFSENAALQSATLTNLPQLTAISLGLFSEDTALTNLTISNLPSVTSIGENAFIDTPIPSVDFINGLSNLVSIGTSAFYNCKNITNVNFHDLPNLTSFGDSIFYRCPLINKFTLKNLPSLTNIGTQMFTNDTNLAVVDIDVLPSLTEIGANAFGSTSISTVDFLNKFPNLITIGAGAFARCSQITNVYLHDLQNLTTLGDMAFISNYSLKNVTLENLPLLTGIPYAAFAPDSLAYLPSMALETVTFTNLPAVTIIGISAFGTCTNLKSVDFSGVPNLQTIDYDAFGRTLSLTDVDLSNLTKLTTIGSLAFNQSGVQTLELANLPSLKTLGQVTFSDSKWDDPTHSGLSSRLNRIVVGNLTAGVTTYGTDKYSTFYAVKSSGQVIPSNSVTDLQYAITFRDNINSVNPSFGTDRSLVWYIPATITYKFIDQNGQPIDGVNSVIDNDGIRIGDVITGTANAPYASYTVKSATSLVGQLNGYDNPKITSNSAKGTINAINSVITYQYETVQAKPFTVSYVDIQGKQISGIAPQTITGTFNDLLSVPQKTATDAGYNALENYDFKGIRVSTDAPDTWQSISAIPGDGYTLGDNDGHNYQFVYAKRSSVTQAFIDEDGHPILTDINGTPVNHNTLDKDSSDSYDYGDTVPEIPGYGDGHWANIDGSSSVAGEITDDAKVVIYQYQTVAKPGKIYYVDTNGNQISKQPTTTVTGYIHTPFDFTAPVISDYKFTGTGKSSDNATAFDNGTWNSMTLPFSSTTLGENDGQSYQLVYAAATSITHKYVDQDGIEIKKGMDGIAVNHFTMPGFVGDDYSAHTAPQIAGYGEPKLISDNASGKMTNNQIEIVYEYRTDAQPTTIYRVDSDGKDLVSPEYINDKYNDDVLNLALKQQNIAGYNFQELYTGSAKLRALTDYDWKVAHELIGQTIPFGINNGRSFKFVYTKKSLGPNNNVIDSPSTSTDPGKLPDNNSGEVPAKPTQIDPGTLPGTGGDGTIPRAKSPNTVSAYTVNNSVNKSKSNQNTDLPKSGQNMSYLLPIVGAILMMTTFGLYSFSKKHK